jgi:transglutaminase-like putative cysteine protease
LADAAAVDGLRPDLVRLARIVTAGLSARDAAQAIHALVRDGVRFAAEPSETFSGALITARWRVGDCDDSARLLVALARASGLNAGIAQLPPPPAAPVHVAAAIWAAGGWRWAETTIAAEFGEHPVVAARRLGIRCRSDLAMIRFRRANG